MLVFAFTYQSGDEPNPHDPDDTYPVYSTVFITAKSKEYAEAAFKYVHGGLKYKLVVAGPAN